MHAVTGTRNVNKVDYLVIQLLNTQKFMLSLILLSPLWILRKLTKFYVSPKIISSYLEKNARIMIESSTARTNHNLYHLY